MENCNVAKKKTPRPDEMGLPEDTNGFASRLKELTKHHGMSRRRLAAELADLVPDAELPGISPASVSRWFDDPIGPNLAHLSLLAAVFNTTIDALVDPAIPVDQLPPRGTPESSLSHEEAEVLRLVRRIGVDVAMNRLLLRDR